MIIQKSFACLSGRISPRTFLCILIPSAIMLLAGCGQEQKQSGYVRRVLLQTLTDGQSDRAVTYPGRTRASEEANVAFRVSGTLQRVYVKAGDYVRQGQVIARMDDRDYRVQFEAAEAEYTQVRNEANRVMSLYTDDGVGTANNYDKARYGLHQMEQKLQHCRDQVADCMLRAPFDGYVQSVLRDSYETVGAGMPVISLIGQGQTEVIINIPASENLRRDMFASFSASFDVVPDVEFPLQLLNIARQANVNQLYEVRLGLKGNHPQITPGMSTMVHLRYKDNGRRSITVPLSAIHHSGKASYVFVYVGGKVSRKQVTLGAVHGNGTVDIRSGLNIGDQIVVSGVHTLTDGESVTPATQPSETNVGGLL